MGKLVNFAKTFGVSALSFGIPLSALAQNVTPSPLPLPPPPATTPGQLVIIICGAIGWLFWGLIVLTVIFVLVAAYKYLTAAGNPEKVKAAGNTLLYAAVAVVVALLAKGVPLIIASFLGSNLAGTGC